MTTLLDEMTPDSPLAGRRKVLLAMLAATLTGCQATLEPLRLGNDKRTDSVAPAPAATAQPQTELQRVQAILARELPDALTAGDVVRATRFQGVWAIGNTLRPSLPRYFDEKAQWFVNVPQAVGLQGLPEAMTKSAVDARRLNMAAQLEVTQWILIQHKTKPVALVYGAHDCPFSRKMEADMARAGFSYYVIPSGLTPESSRQASQAYTSVDPARAWQDLLARGRSAVPQSTARTYPDHDATDIAFLFMSGGKPFPSTPLVVFADGMTLGGWETAKGMPHVQTRIKQKLFFD